MVSRTMSKNKDLFRSKNNNTNDYDAKYIKIKFNWYDDLPLKKSLELLDIIIVVRSVYNNGNKYNPVFWDTCCVK